MPQNPIQEAQVNIKQFINQILYILGEIAGALHRSRVAESYLDRLINLRYSVRLEKENCKGRLLGLLPHNNDKLIRFLEEEGVIEALINTGEWVGTVSLFRFGGQHTELGVALTELEERWGHIVKCDSVLKDHQSMASMSVRISLVITPSLLP